MSRPGSVSRFVLTLLLCGLQPGLVAGVVAGADDDRVLRVGNGPEPESLDPHRVRGVSAANIVRDLYEGLTAIGRDGHAVPAAASSWTLSEDGLQYVFTLRDDGRWSNGEAVVAEDFAAGLRRSLTPATGSSYAQMFDCIRNAAAVSSGRRPPSSLGVAAPDAQHLVIDLAVPCPALPGLLANPAAFPVHRPDLEQWGEGFARPGRMVSNGAYVLADWVVQSHVGLVRNPHFRQRAPIAVVRYVNTEDVNAEFKRFRAGELDVSADVPPVAARQIRRDYPDQLHVAPYLGIYYYGLNLTRAPFEGKPGLRRALAMVIDRRIIAEKVMNGLAVPAWSWIPPGTDGADPQRPDWADWSRDRRLAEARRLYAAAGYDAAHPLDVEIRYNTHESHRRIAIVVAAMWKQALGVRTHLVNQEFKVFLQSRHLMRDTQVFRSAWIADFNDPSSLLGILRGGDGNNDTGWRDAEFDRLTATAARTVDPQRRRTLYAQAERRIDAGMPVIPIYFYVSKHLVSPRVRGWVDNVLDVHYSRDLQVVDTP